jgi:hypothetical protein
MGPILDRTQEHLVAADQAVVRLRRRVLDNIKLVEGGGDALGAMTPDLTGLVASDVNVPAGTPWQELAKANVEIAKERTREPV